MKLIKWVSRVLSAIERSLLVFILGTMILLAFLQVVMRNVFSTGFLWADPLLRHLVLWVGFVGASLATQQEKHINIDLVTRFLSVRSVNLIRIFTNAFAGTVCFALSRAAWTFLISERLNEGALFTAGSIDYPLWWFQLIIPVGFGLMTFRFFIRTVEHVREAIHPTEALPPSTPLPMIDT